MHIEKSLCALELAIAFTSLNAACGGGGWLIYA